ncbi:hypothetical protein J2800_001046 [Caulobacter rhizosphaerae]|uniref:Uncharacterized protein n=1 Tax=Caulobacter rhizosphaerae TaxID=2010972 RepID=A0ABU1MWT9_9CAUL|nr:hypothetical protein [Caulobacter rhizosphaerae]MDR6530310.1 hypothetical protein [Caulobacter rhizosphaerae]
MTQFFGYGFIDDDLKHGQFSVWHGDEEQFSAPMTMSLAKDYDRWRVSLYGVTVLRSLDWITDLVIITEAAKMNYEAKNRERARHETAVRAAAVKPTNRP